MTNRDDAHRVPLPARDGAAARPSPALRSRPEARSIGCDAITDGLRPRARVPRSAPEVVHAPHGSAVWRLAGVIRRSCSVRGVRRGRRCYDRSSTVGAMTAGRRRGLYDAAAAFPHAQGKLGDDRPADHHVRVVLAGLAGGHNLRHSVPGRLVVDRGRIRAARSAVQSIRR